MPFAIISGNMHGIYRLILVRTESETKLHKYVDKNLEKLFPYFEIMSECEDGRMIWNFIDSANYDIRDNKKIFLERLHKCLKQMKPDELIREFEAHDASDGRYVRIEKLTKENYECVNIKWDRNFTKIIS